jgi:hypothetical protein
MLLTEFILSDGDKVSDYEMKLMDIETDHLGIPVRQYCSLSV